MRITKSHVEAKVSIVNGMLGFDRVEWNTVGALRLDGAYGGHAVYRIASESGGVSDLTGGHGTLREASEFLSGMIAALRIAQESADV